MPFTSSASQLDEIAPPISASEQKHESAKLNSASPLPSTVPHNTLVVSNKENDMAISSASAKRPIHDDSSEEKLASSLPVKKAATSSPANGQPGTVVPKERGGEDLPKISAFTANAPQPRGRGFSQGDKSPKRAPRFSKNTTEGSMTSAQSTVPLKSTQHNGNSNLQDWHLKRLINFVGLEIGIQHQIVNALELSPPPPPPKKTKQWKTHHSSNRPGWKNWSHWNSLVTWKLAQYLSKVWKPNCHTCGCFVDTVRLPCAYRFAPIFMVQSHFQYCCQWIKKIHIIIET